MHLSSHLYGLHLLLGHGGQRLVRVLVPLVAAPIAEGVVVEGVELLWKGKCNSMGYVELYKHIKGWLARDHLLEIKC